MLKHGMQIAKSGSCWKDVNPYEPPVSFRSGRICGRFFFIYEMWIQYPGGPPTGAALFTDTDRRTEKL